MSFPNLVSIFPSANLYGDNQHFLVKGCICYTLQRMRDGIFRKSFIIAIDSREKKNQKCNLYHVPILLASRDINNFPTLRKNRSWKDFINMH